MMDMVPPEKIWTGLAIIFLLITFVFIILGSVITVWSMKTRKMVLFAIGIACLVSIPITFWASLEAREYEEFGSEGRKADFEVILFSDSPTTKVIIPIPDNDRMMDQLSDEYGNETNYVVETVHGTGFQIVFKKTFLIEGHVPHGEFKGPLELTMWDNEDDHEYWAYFETNDPLRRNCTLEIEYSTSYSEFDDEIEMVEGWNLYRIQFGRWAD